MAELAIQTINLTKRYGDLFALENLNLEIAYGDCFGFIGPNGAGKSTTIKILATLLKPTWGEARVCGKVVGFESPEIRPLIGYVPDEFGAYEDMVVEEYLEFFAAAYDIHGERRRKVIDDVLELTDLGYKREALVDSLSRGMQQRLSLARVLLHDPKLLLLDEPASGLDPRARVEIRELMKELRRMGKTILISSHILPEMEDLCNKVGIIERGNLIFSGPIEEATRRARETRRLVIRVGGGADRAAEAAKLLAATPELSEPAAEGDRVTVTIANPAVDHAFIAELLIAKGFRLLHFAEEEVNLETAFMRLTRGVVQ
jgi:ABC-2 type transport system ATP-binding protein